MARPPQLYVLTGAEPGVLYSWPRFPAGIQLGNDTGISGLRWSRGSLAAAHATGTISEDLCTRSCAGGPFEKFPVQLEASRPGSCPVEASEVLERETYEYYRQAYVYTRFTGQVLGGAGAPGLGLARRLLDLSPRCPSGRLPSTNWPPVDWATSSAPAGGLVWGRPRAVNPGRGTGLVSCASEASCLVTGGDPSYPEAGGAVVNESTYWDGTSWSPARQFGTNGTNVSSVSCAPSLAKARSAAPWCVAVDDAGDAMVFNGRSWTTPQPADRYGGLGSVSCPLQGFCVAVDYTGHALVYNGLNWLAPVTADPAGNLRSVSCPTAHFCMAVGSDGRAVMYNGASWSAPRLIDQDGGGLASVSCPSAHFCAAVDFNARVLAWDASSWSAPRYIGVGAAGADSYGTPLACPSAQLCVLVDNAANAFTYNGRAWSAPTFTASPAGGLSSVACPSASFCIAIDDYGNAVAGRPAHGHSHPTTVGGTSTTNVA